MKCEQFWHRMDVLLDERQDVGRDPLLCDHAKDCEPCRQRQRLCSDIEAFALENRAACSDDASKTSRVSGFPLRYATLLATAAAILICVAWGGRMIPTDQTTFDAPLATSGVSPAVPPTSQNVAEFSQHNALPIWQSGQWWSALSEDQWVSHTLPAVNSVRIGVAPVGRSMKQAFAILMIQTGQPTIETPGSMTPELQVAPYGEQTSTVDRHLALVCFT